MLDVDLRTMYDELPGAIVVSDSVTGRILDCNSAAERLTGRSRGEMIGMHHAGLLAGNNTTNTHAEFLELVKKGHATNYQTEILTKRGENVPVVINASHVKVKGKDAVLQVFTFPTEETMPADHRTALESSLRTIMAAMRDMMVMVDTDFNITEVNDRVVAVLNLHDKKAAIGHKCFEILRERKDACPLCAVAEAYKPAHPALLTSTNKCEVRIGGRSFETFAYPIRNEEGKLLGAVECYRDVTEQERAEQTLEMVEQRFKDLTETTKDWVWEVDERGVYTYSSSKVKDLLGYEVSEILGKGLFDFLVPPDEAERAISVFKEKLSRRHPISGLENISRHKDGHLVVLETNASPVLDKEGWFKGYRGTHSRLAQYTGSDEVVQRVQKGEEKLHALTENTNDIVYSATADGMITYIGSQVTRYGLSPTEVTSRNILDIIVPEDRERVRLCLEKSLSTGEESPTELRIADKDGKVHWFEDSAKPQRNESGAVIGIAGVLRDITDRRRAQQEYSSLVELSPDGIVLLKGEEIIFANRRAYEMFGFSESECASENIKKVLAVNFAEMLNEMSEDERLKMMDSLSKAAEGKTKHFSYQVPLKRKSGEQIWVEVNTSPVQHEGDNVELAFLRDISDRKNAESALHESEERFRAIIENSSDALTILNSDGTIRYESPSVERVLGYKPEELVGKSIFDLIHPDERHNIVVNFGSLLNSPGAMLTMEIRYLHKDGSWRYAEGIGKNSMHDPKIKGFICTYRDITERKLAEQALRESETKYRTLVEELLEGVVITQPNPTHLVFANPGMATLLGYTAEELTSLSPEAVQTLVHPDDQELFFSRFKDRIEGKPVPEHYEFRGIKKDGTVIWLRVSSRRIDCSGKPAVLAIFKDVTEKKQAELALQESEQLFRAVADSSPDIISILGLDGIVLYSSPSVERILGYVPSERIGMNAMHDIHPEDLQRLTDMLKADMQSLPGRPRTVEYRQKHRDGSWRTLQSTGQLLVIDSAVSAIVVNSRDVTEHMQTEEALREHEQGYSYMLELSPDGVVLLKGEDVIFANHRLYEMFDLDPADYTEEDIKSALVTSFAEMLNEMHEDDRARMMESLSNINEGLIQRFEYQVPLKRKSGERIWVEVSTSPFGLKGEMVELSFLRDITFRKRAEEVLREHEQEYHSLLELSPDGVVLLKGEEVIFANRRLYEMFGLDKSKYTEEDIKNALAASFAEMLNEMDADERAQMMESLASVNEGLIHRFEYQVPLKRQSGERIWVEVSTSPFQYKGEMVELSFMRDISARKRRHSTQST